MLGFLNHEAVAASNLESLRWKYVVYDQQSNLAGVYVLAAMGHGLVRPYQRIFGMNSVLSTIAVFNRYFVCCVAMADDWSLYLATPNNGAVRFGRVDG